MKQIYFFLLFFSLGIQGLAAQSDFTFMLNKEGRLIALPRRIGIELNIPKFSYKTYTPSSTRMIDDILKAYQPVTNQKMDERPMDMQVLSSAYKPFYNYYTPMLKRVSPTAFDFKVVEFHPINENLTFAIEGRQYTWPGLGGVTSISPSLVWKNGPFQLSGGAYAARYYTPFNLSPELVTGANIYASYQITDWLKLNSWGQYAHYFGRNEKNNPHILMNPFFYHNSIGSSLEFKLNDKFGIGTGIQYDFNPMRNKWERRLLIFPAFY